MNNIESEMLKKEIGKIAENVLDDEIKKGKELIEKCEYYHNKMKQFNINDCITNNHQEKVLEFISNIQNKYTFLINVYASFRRNYSSENNEISCKSLVNYVDFLENLKKVKKASDDFEKCIKLLKGEVDENE